VKKAFKMPKECKIQYTITEVLSLPHMQQRGRPLDAVQLGPSVPQRDADKERMFEIQTVKDVAAKGQIQEMVDVPVQGLYCEH
jgi:hypothetical protein